MMSLPNKRYPFFLELLALFMVGAFFISLIPLAHENLNSSSEDQRDYLKIALWIADGSRFTDGNRHPLYPLLLAPLATRDISFFTKAKILSMLIGTLSLGVVFVISRHIVSEVGALAVLGLMVWNNEFRHTAVSVHVEVLLVSLFLLAWFSAVKALNLSPTTARLWPSLAGLLAGLAYLAKANGTLLVLIYLAALFWLKGRNLLRSANFWFFIAAFCLIALPLWLYNLAQYGSPLFNINTNHYMWLDSWEESYVYEASDLPSLLSYWQTHSLSQIGDRVKNGLLLAAPKQWYGALRLTFMPETREAANTAVLVGIFLFILITNKVYQEWRQRRALFLYTCFGLLLFGALFAWYHPISDAPRFILPWTAVIYIAVVWLIQSWLSERGQTIYTQIVLATAVFTVAILGGQNGRFLPQLTHMAKQDRSAAATPIAFMQTILQQSEPGDRFLLGPTHAQIEWLAYDRFPIPLPHTPSNWPYLSTVLIQENIHLALLDAESFARRQSLLQNYWRLDENGLWATSLPLGWDLHKPQAYPCNPCLYTFDPQVFVPATSYQLQYNSVARLDGYTLSASNSNEPITLITHWRLLSDLAETFHIFVHVVNNEGEIVAQHDAPLAVDLSFYPEESFPAGTMLRGEHVLPRPEPGRYHVHVGLYNWTTQERVSLVVKDDVKSENYPLLLSIEIGES